MSWTELMPGGPATPPALPLRDGHAADLDLDDLEELGGINP